MSLVALKHGHDEPLVAVNPPREEEVDVPVEAAEVAAGEVPATAQAAPEAGAEGEDKEGKDKDKDKDKDAKKGDKKEKG